MATLGQTSVRNCASKSLMRLCRIDGIAPLEQLSAWLRLSVFPHAQCEGSLSSCHPYLTHKALGAWFSRCRVELGDIGVGTCRKLMTLLVESTMLYGAEIWGCN